MLTVTNPLFDTGSIDLNKQKRRSVRITKHTLVGCVLRVACYLAIPPEVIIFYVSDVEILRCESVFFNESTPWLNLVSHEGGKDFISFVGIFDLYMEESARVGVHCSLPQLPWVHLSQSFVTLDFHSVSRARANVIDNGLLVSEYNGLVLLKRKRSRTNYL